MTILDRQNYLKEIERDGVSATDKSAERKIKDYMINLVTSTQYHKSKVIEMTKAIAENYYAALPEKIADKQLEALYESVKNTKPKENSIDKIITLYESEMQNIAALKEDRLMRMAFAALILHKFKGLYMIDNNRHCHRAISACEADVYKLAELQSISAAAKDKLWNQLCQKGLVKFFVNTNRAYRFNREWLAIPMMSVDFNVDLKQDKSGEKVFAQIKNHDNLLLWLQLWKEQKIKRKTLIRCAECGNPILKRKKTVCLCNVCAEKRNKANKAAYNKRIKKAN